VKKLPLYKNEVREGVINKLTKAIFFTSYHRLTPFFINIFALDPNAYFYDLPPISCGGSGGVELPYSPHCGGFQILKCMDSLWGLTKTQTAEPPNSRYSDSVGQE